jgi:hypothetical protein
MVTPADSRVKRRRPRSRLESMRWWAAIGTCVLSAMLAAPALAQQTPPGVQIETQPEAPPERAKIVPPGLHYETTRPPDANDYPVDIRVEHDPAFIEPFTVKTEGTSSSGQYGLSGWTSPNTPVGPSVLGYREISGWFGLGFSIVWNGPPPKRPASFQRPFAPVR